MKSLKYVLFFGFLFLPQLLMSQMVARFGFDEPSGETMSIEALSLAEFPISNHFDRPERIAGVQGNALRLDGWSTWIEAAGFQIPDISNKLTIEAWHSTECFTATPGGIVSQIGGGTGFSLEVGPFGNLIWAFHANGQFYLLSSTQKLEKYRWNHIVATADLEQQVAKIYVNGAECMAQNLGAHTSLTLDNGPLYIGRQTNDNQFAGFTISALNGALDEVTFYNTVLTPVEVLSHYQLYQDVVPDLTINPSVRYAGDHLRPQYHPMPDANWTNEAYGLTYFNGKYQLFFQKNPNGPYLYFMHWGHLSSPDLVNWTEEKIALAPSEGFDSFGTWSGTTIKDENGQPVIFYTGVDGVKAGIGGAEAEDDDLLNWTEFGENALINSAPATPLNMDFRDPYVWKSNDFYYMMVGSGLRFNGGGIVFLYRSENLTDWTPMSFLYRDANTSRSGLFWEMPFFLPIGNNKYILGVTPTPQPNQRAQVLYWIGTWENEAFTPDDVNPKKFELINENLLAPAMGIDEADRLTYIGIIPEDRAVEDQVAAGWRQTFSIPRATRLLNDGSIGHIPHPNLCRLRGDLVSISDREILPNSDFNLPEFSGTQSEFRFQIQAEENTKFSIQVYKHQDGQEQTSLVFDFENDKISLDRQQSSLSNTLEDLRIADYDFSPEDTLWVDIFLDHSTLEIFVDQLVVFSARVYPAREESNLLDLVAEQGSVVIQQLNAWSLFGIGESSSEDTCEPGILPDSLFNPPTATNEVLANQQALFSLAPNPAPAGTMVLFSGDDFPNGMSLKVYSPEGKLWLQQALDNDYQWLDLQSVPSGFYLLEVRSDGFAQIMKLIVR